MVDSRQYVGTWKYIQTNTLGLRKALAMTEVHYTLYDETPYCV
jgi:hypothetical protein